MKIRQSGFTFIEVLVVVAIAGVLASMAIPSFQELMMRRATQAAADSLVNDMRFARAEALKRSTKVVICSLDAAKFALSPPQIKCAQASGKWTAGWAVFADLDGNKQIDTGEDVVRVMQAPSKIASIQSTNPSSDLWAFTFEANGWARSATQTFTITPTGNVSSRTTKLVCISLQGRPSIRAEGATICS